MAIFRAAMDMARRGGNRLFRTAMNMSRRGVSGVNHAPLGVPAHPESYTLTFTAEHLKLVLIIAAGHVMGRGLTRVLFGPPPHQREKA